ncbi:MAG: hypothetical protein ABR521_06375 [Gaiellaceae bacterium]
MRPRFHMGEVVRVLSTPPTGENDDTELRGSEAVLTDCEPHPDQPAWWYTAWVPAVEEMWMFEEERLEATGLIQPGLDDSVRVPVEAADMLSLEAEVTVAVDGAKRQGLTSRLLAEAAERGVREVVPLEALRRKPEPHHPGWSRIRVRLQLRPEMPAVDAFERLVMAMRNGSVDLKDDGWAAQARWEHSRSSNGSLFLAPEVDKAFVWLHPISALRRRPLRLAR